MSHDHLLHAEFGDRGWFHLTFECVGDPTDHYSLVERACDCDCSMCSGDDPDHWGCDLQPHDLSFDGLAPCQTAVETQCWVHMQDCSIEETLVGDWPKRPPFPVPVRVTYEGDGEWSTHYAGEATP